jgi:hypothetical protein
MWCEALASCCTTLKGRTTKFGGEKASAMPGDEREIKLNSL